MHLASLAPLAGALWVWELGGQCAVGVVVHAA